MHMTEPSALDLACVTTTDVWIQSYEDGVIVFPILASVNIRRVLKTANYPSHSAGIASDASQLAGTASDGARMTSVVIVHAKEQPWGQHRTQDSLAMVKALRTAS